MDAIRRLLVYLALGGIAGFVVWGLDRSDRLSAGVWIAVGAVVGAALFGFVVNDRRVHRSVPAGTPAQTSSPQAGALGESGELRRIRSRLGGYGTTAFLAAGLFIVQRSSDSPSVDQYPDWLPGWLRWEVTDIAYDALTLLFIVLAALMLTLALPAPLTKRTAQHAESYLGRLLPLLGVVVLAGVVVAWGSGISTLAHFGVSAAVYVYGGFAIIALTALYVVSEAWSWLSEMRARPGE